MLTGITNFFSSAKFFFDSEVREQIFSVVREANRELYLVSPYNKHPNQLENDLLDAIQRDVSVTLIYRDEKDQHEGARSLEAKGATALPVKWLHTKLYMNESTALATSMNLLDSSFNNSLEFCFRVNKQAQPELYNQLADYIARIRQRAEQSNATTAANKSAPAKVAPKKPNPSKAAAPKPASAKTAAKSAPPPQNMPKAATDSATGHCIRCGESIDRNPDRPFCMACYTSWKRYKKIDYPERYCHACGRIAETSGAKTSMERPLGLCCAPARS